MVCGLELRLLDDWISDHLLLHRLGGIVVEALRRSLSTTTVHRRELIVYAEHGNFIIIVDV